MILRSNINSMNSSRQLGKNDSLVAKSIEKLASGYAINRAADDAAGLAITEKMRSQITGLDQGTNNALDGVSLVQTAEGAMSEIHDMLNRMVELSTQSANGTMSDEVDRQAIQSEVDVLGAEITRIALATNFNGIPLLDGTLSKDGAFTDIGLNVFSTTIAGFGFDANEIDFTNMTGQDLVDTKLSVDGGDLLVNFADINSKPNDYVQEFNFVIPGEYTIYIDTSTNANDIPPFEATKSNGTHYIFSTNGDIYGASTGITGFANDGSTPPTISLESNDGQGGLILHVADQNVTYNKIKIYIDPMTGKDLSIEPLCVDTQENAGFAIDVINSAINKVSTNRANVGAMQNRLEYTINNNNNTSENMSSAKSVIKDCDMAKEMMEYTKMNVLVQSAQSMLVQSNQSPQQILSLLG